jgi:hypothetical protein
MQLKIQRSQRMGGAFGNTVVFCLDVRADYTPTETSNIAKYKLGGQVIYNSGAAAQHLDKASARFDRAADMGGGMKSQMTGLVGGIYSMAMAKMKLNISIASLGKGHHIECKDLGELMEAEEAVMAACRNIRDYLNLAASFNGSTILVDFSVANEQVHTALGGEVYAPPPAFTSAGTATLPPPSAPVDAKYDDVSTPAGDGRSLMTIDLPYFQFGDEVQAITNLLKPVRALYAKEPVPFWVAGALIAFIGAAWAYGVAAASILGIGLSAGLVYLLLRKR